MGMFATMYVEMYGKQVKDVDAALGQWSAVTARKIGEAKKAVEKVVDKRAGKFGEKLKDIIRPKKKK
jgi:hypothetical protein